MFVLYWKSYRFDVILHGKNITQHIDGAMRSWWTEYKKYGNTDPKNRYFSRLQYYGWANMAKGKSTRIGCSYSSCDGQQRALFSCIYNERAHCENQPIYEAGKPCEIDDDCTTFPRSKCIQSLGLCQVSSKLIDRETNTMCAGLNTTMSDDTRIFALDQHNFYRQIINFFQWNCHLD
ncbi:hypothetical protein DICVIV_10953 [Dictyocaulus viviparus]|uniref:SCP domain-containing protein n=1 Tax=Dictyocaulus viviparus TaxID=29172 RepID=A0A0D8XL24_DICVI|nr:hypothetical protein DICVIV_10953 [Dictyocaulus viviparus]